MSLPQRVFTQIDADRPGAFTASAMTLTVLVELTGPLDADVLDAAYRDLIARNEPLRCRPLRGTRWMEMAPFDPADAALTRLPPGAAHEADRERLAALLAATPVDLDAPPLVRGYLLTRGSTRGPGRHLLGLVFHHFAVDPTSLRLAVAELAAAYTARLTGGPPPPAPAMTYTAYAARQAARLAARAEADRAAWREALAGTGVPRYRREVPFAPGTAGPVRTLRTEVLDATAAERVFAWSRRHRSTPFTTLLAAFALALRARAYGEDLVVLTVFEQRDHPAVRRLIGPFIHLTPIPLHVPDGPPGADLVPRVRTAVVAAYERAQYPLRDALAAAPHLMPGLRGAEPSWFRMFEYLPARDTGGYAFGEATGRVVHSAGQDDGGDQGLFLRVRRTAEGALVGRLAYDAAEFGEAGAQSFLADFRARLTALTA
ncbi:condensation domain-containing protein [Streptomyces sp. B1866]|uniref:condensation domain-containing protein n=1 Tax=Streptomyces sp. B1866 TaxID=3075431 RepID=UPI00288D4020|nr:condensation domain-containing protein [Streptomyces sp. B1866]MDT3397330.1 condensation domain-containing protein [Streptomyces sp. B1866]